MRAARSSRGERDRCQAPRVLILHAVYHGFAPWLTPTDLQSGWYARRLTVEPDLPPDLAEPDPAYRAALAWIWSFSPTESPHPRSAADRAARRGPKVERARTLLHLLGDPQRAFPTVLVGGTKGKGSTAAMVAASLHAAGYHTGRYTSPHLVSWRERTWVDGHAIATDEVVRLVGPLRSAVETLPAPLGPPTTFEVGTALTFLHFADQALDVAVVEVGVGGLTDATNLADPLVSAITPISHDHAETLGPTLADIASHKAGIMRAGRPTILGPQPPEALAVLEAHADRIGAHLERVGREWTWRRAGRDILVESTHPEVEPLLLEVPLVGAHQRDNATLAAATLHALGRARPAPRVAPAAIQRGLRAVEWPGRLQTVRTRPRLVLDGAHNRASADAVAAALRHEYRYARLHLVLGLSEGKDAAGVVEALVPLAAAVLTTRSRHERAADPEVLARLVRERGPDTPVRAFPDLAGALSAATADAGEGDLILVTGSLFLVGEALALVRAPAPAA